MALFNSLFWAGFDCTSGLNVDRRAMDHTVATRHDVYLEADYARLREVGIGVVREGLCWSTYDGAPAALARHLRRVFAAARSHGMQAVFDLCHFGYPSGLDPFSRDFVTAFAAYCRLVARLVSEHADVRCALTPMNEPSYWAWAGGEAALFSPHANGRAFELKVCLVRAALAGIDAIWSVIPDAVIVNADPVCRAVAPRTRPDLTAVVDAFNAGAVLESWDMLAGRMLPELGGTRRHLGVIGVNYYWTNQWEWGDPEVPLPDDDDRRWSLSELVAFVWRRYGGEIVISETAHIGDRRADWIQTVVAETRHLWSGGVPLSGVCLYPVLGMPHWHRQNDWLMMGLWDLQEPDRSIRVPHAPALEALAAAQMRLARARRRRSPHRR
jgi:hypothetical protein